MPFRPAFREAASKSHSAYRDRLASLADVLPALILATIAASSAWLIAEKAFGERGAFFAPVAAVITMGLAAGQRLSRAAEISLGVPLGIALSDVIVMQIGVGVWQLALVVFLAMTSAVVLHGSSLIVNQAAISAILVVTLQPPGHESMSFARAGDALIGSGMALAMHFLIAPLDPVRYVGRRATPLVEKLAEVLGEIAVALEVGDRDAAASALLHARGLDGATDDLISAVAAGRETATAAPQRRRSRGTVDRFAHAAEHLDLAVRDTRVLARSAIRALEIGDRVPPEVPGAIRDLAESTRRIDAWFDDERHERDARGPAVHAARTATAVLEQTSNLSVSVIIGQVRSTAVDLLRATGMELREARALVRGERRLDADDGERD